MRTLLLILLLVPMMSFGQIVSYDTNDTIIYKGKSIEAASKGAAKMKIKKKLRDI